MNKYENSFYLFDGEAKQIPIIPMHGAPTEDTEGAVGLILMDVDAPGCPMYKCVEVTEEGNSVWEPFVDRLAYENEIVSLALALTVDKEEDEASSEMSFEEFYAMFGSQEAPFPNVKYTLFSADGSEKCSGYYTDETGAWVGHDAYAWTTASVGTDYVTVCFHYYPDIAIGDTLRLSRTKINTIDEKYIPKSIIPCYDVERAILKHGEMWEGGHLALYPGNFDLTPDDILKISLTFVDATEKYRAGTTLTASVRFGDILPNDTLVCDGIVAINLPKSYSLEFRIVSEDVGQVALTVSKVTYTKQLEERYIPDNIARKSDLHEPSAYVEEIAIGSVDGIYTTYLETYPFQDGDALEVSFETDTGLTFNERIELQNTVPEYHVCNGCVKIVWNGIAAFEAYNVTEEAGFPYKGVITLVRLRTHCLNEALIPDTIARTILTSPSGKKFKITVADDGTLSTEAVE